MEKLPARLSGRKVPVSLRASDLVVFDGRAVVARHPRNVTRVNGRFNWVTTWRSFKTKPGALPRSTGH
jgi:hypothetical protein